MGLTKVVLGLALLVASTCSSPLLHPKVAQFDPGNRVDSDYRLPNNSKPMSYVIKLNPDLSPDSFTFEGETQIFLEVLIPSYTITLHTDALTYRESLTTLVSEDNVTQTITSHSYIPTENFLLIRVANELSVGNYTLSLTFVGILDDDMYGFYRSSYTTESGDTEWLAATQFEPTSARRAFPCYDEPAFKATFDISIKHERSYHAISNMKIRESNRATNYTDGKIWTQFETTPPMSTYLVAFIVSRYSALKNANQTYNVWSQPNALGQVQYAFKIGSIELAELEDYTNVNYSLPKIDQIAIPDFAAGAMENWGLVTYRENMLYYNEKTLPLSTKQTVATTISHEFAHQWFGDLVSPSWWKYLWLNEGFATYFEYLITDAVEENWRLMDQFVVKVQQAAAFAFDSMASSHPLNQNVASPAQISAIFDTISYSKGGSVIRMMSHFLTDDVFKAGLTKYLNANAYSVAVPDDLFDALQAAAAEANILPNDVIVKDIMATWVEQMGYPVVTVTRNYTTGTTEVTQERFLLGSADLADDHEYKWWIPLNWVSQAEPNFDLTIAQDWLYSLDNSIIKSDFDLNGWVIFNKQQTGYYRVNYDEKNWNMIASYLNSDNYLKIHLLNRAALIDDAFYLARADRLPYSVTLSLTRYLQREVDYIPWYPAFVGFNYLNTRLANTNEYESLRVYISSLLREAFDSVGIEDSDSDDHVTRLGRAKIIEYACYYGLTSCRSQAEEKILTWLNDSTASPFSTTLQTETICAGLRSANATIWNKAMSRYWSSESPEEKFDVLSGLGCSEDEEIINNWLYTITDSTTEWTTAASSVAFEYIYEGSVYNVDRAFDFIVNNVDRIVSYYDDSSTVGSFVHGIANRMNTQSQLNKLKAFIADHPTILGSSATTAVDRVESNIAWNAVYEPQISAWVIETLKDPGFTTTAPENEVTTQHQTTTEPSTLETTTSAAEDPTTVDPGSSAATAYLNFFLVILAFISLARFN